jgi:hypothetical protein
MVKKGSGSLAAKLIAVKKNGQSEITHLKLDDGQIVTLKEAQDMAHQGLIDSISDLQSDGSWKIDDELQHAEGNNLGHLPEFQ